MPELAAIFLIGQVLTWILTGVLGYKIRRKARETEQIDQNLRSVGFLWDKSTDEIIPLQTLTSNSNRLGLVKSFFLMGFIFSFFSWFGAIGVIIFYFTFSVINQSSRYESLIKSKLNGTGNFSATEVKSMLNELQIQIKN